MLWSDSGLDYQSLVAAAEARQARLARWLERFLIVLVVSSFFVGIWALTDPHIPNCDEHGRDHSIGPTILLFGGVLPAALGAFFYFIRLALPKRRAWVHFAGLAALLLTILEFIGAGVWAFSNGVICWD